MICAVMNLYNGAKVRAGDNYELSEWFDIKVVMYHDSVLHFLQ